MFSLECCNCRMKVPADHPDVLTPAGYECQCGNRIVAFFVTPDGRRVPAVPDDDTDSPFNQERT
jgi:hypothetical protein